MARALRIEYPGAVYHITSRGNERRSIYQDDKDRFLFFKIIKDVVIRSNWICHSYCLMDNHYHLLLETVEGNLSKGMRQLNGVYTQVYNRRHKRVGHLFQGRYKAILIEKDNYLLEVSRYIILNPVRAKLIKHPCEWRWSSYAGTIGKGRKEEFLNTEWILEQFGNGNNKSQAQEKFQQFVMEGINQEFKCRGTISPSILGDIEFIKRIEGYLVGKEKIEEIPRVERLGCRPNLKEIFTDEIINNKVAEKDKILVAVYDYGYSQKELSDFLGIHYSTVSKIIQRARLRKSRFKT